MAVPVPVTSQNVGLVRSSDILALLWGYSHAYANKYYADHIAHDSNTDRHLTLQSRTDDTG